MHGHCSPTGVDVEVGCLAQKVELRFQADDIDEFSIEDDQCIINILEDTCCLAKRGGISILSRQVRYSPEHSLAQSSTIYNYIFI
jgi:hypothetical protein